MKAMTVGVKASSKRPKPTNVSAKHLWNLLPKRTTDEFDKDFRLTSSQNTPVPSLPTGNASSKCPQSLRVCTSVSNASRRSSCLLESTFATPRAISTTFRAGSNAYFGLYPTDQAKYFK